MNEIKKRIIELLKEHKRISVGEISSRLNYSESGVRGRISELRKMGYDIQNKEKHYFLRGMTAKNRILEYLNKTNRYGVAIDINVLGEKLGMSREDIDEGMFELYKDGRLLQLSNTVVKVLL